MSRVRLVPIALIVIVSLAVFFGIWRMYLQFSLVNPLVSSIEQVSGVETAKIVTENPPTIEVKLDPSGDLQWIWQSIQQQINLSGSSNAKVLLESTNSESLYRVREAMNLMITQAMRQGDYKTEFQAAEKEARAMGATARITIDEHNIYVQIAKQGQYLYQVIMNYPALQS